MGRAESEQGRKEGRIAAVDGPSGSRFFLALRQQCSPFVPPHWTMVSEKIGREVVNMREKWDMKEY
jgi:hypothetical protein